MRKLLLNSICLLLFVSPALLKGQCFNCNAQWPTATQSTVSNTLVTVTTCMRGGEYAVFNVTAGETYTWTTCGGGTWDTQLTLFAGGAPGCQGGSLAYNDDFPGCGLLSTITWTATFTGTVNVLLSRFNCQNQATCMGLFWACVSCGAGPGGNYNNPGGTITTCEGNFYDTGGPTGNYSNNEFITTTFCPDVAGECINMTFSQFSIETGWDFMIVYDGPNTGSPAIGTYTGTSLNGITLSATNASGCLTFLFDSDGSVTFPGWAASISCNTCGVPPPAPPTDCIGGTTVCDDATFSGNSGGAGAIVDLNSSNQGCLLSGENQTSWYLFSPATDGNIGFTISPGVGVDYDFAVWGPFPEGSSSADICPPPGPPIRCSYASGFSTNNATGSYDTGTGHAIYSAPQFASPFTTYSEGAAGNGWVPGLNVTAGQVYILVIDNFTSNTTPFNLNWNLQNGATLDCTPLPVEMLEFSGSRIENTNVLRWKTATEINADFYEIQRSLDGYHFNVIGTLPAAGFTTSLTSYVYRDEEPPHSDCYYRLKQIDFDGRYEFFGPVIIEHRESSTKILNLYPNPLTSDLLQVEMSAPHGHTVHLEIMDVTGKPLRELQVAVAKGVHTFAVDFSSYSHGVYFIRFTDQIGAVIDTRRVVR
ncbi:MAG: T9SS C-terminal target domain-containing protein [Cryomorphaceae bacterium]|nr:MAG: T9SS C-terminal target domain-containing protein [Cryomorphaceae bacterium]